MKIAISKGIGTGKTAWKFPKYGEWIRNTNPQIETVELSGLTEKEALQALSSCDGLILTGGPDIDPKNIDPIYGQEARRNECGIIDIERDRLEWSYVKLAIEKMIPIMGICRGMQLLNAYCGGSLVVDIPTDISECRMHRKTDEDTQHEIIFVRSSPLGMDGTKAFVNSAHHQSVAIVASPFDVIARSPDGVIEAMMRKNGAQMPPVLAVQWHPERMPWDEAMSQTPATVFLSFIQERKDK